MTVRVGINGFGRIGRNFLRAVLDQGADVEVVAVNDLTSAETNAHLLRYDSTQGRLPVPVEVVDGDLVVGGRHIKVLAERDPADLPWGDLGVDVVIESTGRFTARHDAAAHLKAGRVPGDHLDRRPATPTRRSSSASTTATSTRTRTSSSRTRRARRTASCRWSRSSTTRSASSAG